MSLNYSYKQLSSVPDEINEHNENLTTLNLNCNNVVLNIHFMDYLKI